MKKKSVLVLGSGGFIGRNLREYLVGLEKYELLTPRHAELDLLNETEIEKYLNMHQPDVVVNAAICRNPKYFHNENTETELQQDLQMFYTLEKFKHLYGKMLYFGSGAEFDKRNSIIKVKETEFINGIPDTEYGLSKYVIGKAIECSENIYNLRIFGLFGKYENWKTTFISGACCKALKGLPITIRKNVVFDYLYIDDFCRIVQWFIDNEPRFHTYNIASGKQRDLFSIANRVKELSGRDVPIYVCEAGLGNEYTADNTRLANENKYFTLSNFDESISKLLEYYRNNLDNIDLTSLLYQA